jgi:hypothetical protein
MECDTVEPEVYSNEETTDAKSQEESELLRESELLSKQLANMRATLGKYWDTVPHHRILMHFQYYPWCPEFEKASITRTISLFSSHSRPKSEPVPIKIDLYGVT